MERCGGGDAMGMGTRVGASVRGGRVAPTGRRVALALAASVCLVVPSGAAARVTRSDGAQLVVATTGALSAQNPAFSPGGGTLLFTRYNCGYDAQSDPACVHPGGGVFQTSPSPGSAIRPLWGAAEATNVNGLSSDNAATGRVAFAVDVPGTPKSGLPNICDVATVAASGAPSTFNRLTNLPAGSNACDAEPTYSPNGRTIVFEQDTPRSGSSDGSIGRLFTISASGGAQVPLLPTGRGVPSGDDRLPVWSPNGTMVLFQRRSLSHLGDDCAFHLWTYDVQTKVQTQVTGVAGATGGLDTCDSDASWSPDGRWLLDSAAYGGLNEDNIFLVSADGARLIRVTRAAVEDGAPAMSPDRKWIYFESHRGSDNAPTELWRIAMPPTPPTPATAA
jgi:TolB protein